MSNKFHFDARLCQSSCQAVTKQSAGSKLLKTLSPPVISTPVTKFWVGIFDLVNNIIQLISEKQGIDRTQFSIPFPFWPWLGKGRMAKVELSILQLPILPRRWNTSGLKVTQLTNKNKLRKRNDGNKDLRCIQMAWRLKSKSNKCVRDVCIAHICKCQILLCKWRFN